jgi:hypothetical protein
MSVDYQIPRGLPLLCNIILGSSGTTHDCIQTSWHRLGSRKRRPSVLQASCICRHIRWVSCAPSNALPLLKNCRHGGSTVSQYLRQELHGLLESANKSHIPEMCAYVKEFGGYFKRFSGGLLSPWINSSMESAGEMDLHARATLTFFEVRTASRVFLLKQQKRLSPHRWTETSRQKLLLKHADPQPPSLSFTPWILPRLPSSMRRRLH